MSSHDEMVFDDVALREVPVKVGGKPYVLKEASAEAVRKYRNAQLRATRVDKDGRPVGLGDMADVELLLVNQCLFDASGRQVALQVLSSWPGRIVKALFQRAQDISELRERDDTEEALTKQLEETQERLARVREAKAGSNGSTTEGKEASEEANPTQVASD